MKLKTAFQDENFKLGEVADVSMATMPDGRIVARAAAKVGGEHTFYYDSLEAVYNDWKDYEEPKEYWCIDWTEDDGIFQRSRYDDRCDDFNKEIGNYFNTREEAEKAVERLRAWKRLKDKGFRFGISGECDNTITYGITLTFADYYGNDETKADIDLLFRGEE